MTIISSKRMKCKDCEFTDCQIRTNNGGCFGGEIQAAPYVPDYWDNLRNKTAKDVLCQLFVRLSPVRLEDGTEVTKVGDVVDYSIQVADLLIEKLRNEISKSAVK